MLKDINKAKKQIVKANEKIKSENLDKVNLTDMDSKMMKMKRGLNYEQAYNCQLLVEDKGEIIVGNNISDSPNDVSETIPTIEKLKDEQNISIKGIEFFQDNGYSGSLVAEYYENEKAVAYIPDRATTKELHGKSYQISKYDNDKFELDFEKNQVICPKGHAMEFVFRRIKNKRSGNWTNVYQTDRCYDCKVQKECLGQKTSRRKRDAEINPLQRKIRLRFKTKEGVEKYNKRFHKGEVAQAHIEHNLGYREFKCRGMKSCENEVNLFSIAYNLKKIHNKLGKISKGFVKYRNSFIQNTLGLSFNLKNRFFFGL